MDIENSKRDKDSNMNEVIVVIGPGLIGQAIARRVGVGKRVVLADRQEANAKSAAETLDNPGTTSPLRWSTRPRAKPSRRSSPGPPPWAR